MGKYMRKAKLSGEVAVMEVSHQSSLGVRTRARTLAQQRLQKLAPISPAPPPPPPSEADNSTYLQLRSRRLEKPIAVASRPKADSSTKSSGPFSKACPAHSESVGSVSAVRGRPRKGEMEDWQASEASPTSDGVEASFGENFFDRNARETTPCSLIRDSETAGTPCSSSRRRPPPAAPRAAPTSDEMESFFSAAELLQQRIFADKYNFDPVKDCALPGRYEWVRVDDL
ncbi:inhibitor/interactor with cyclin-dependent kinase [Wolffia australiana]